MTGNRGCKVSYATYLIEDLLDRGCRVEFRKVDTRYRVEVSFPPPHTRVIISEDEECLYALESAREHVNSLSD